MKGTSDSAVRSTTADPASARSGAALSVRPLAGGLGASIAGIDLRQPWSSAQADSIRDAFITHHFVVVRDQQLTKPRMAEFAGLFGEVEGNVFR